MSRLSRILSFIVVAFAPVSAFVSPISTCVSNKEPHCAIFLSKHSSTDVTDTINPTPASLPVGTVVEFEEKGRRHLGRIVGTEHKSKHGGSRYVVNDAHDKPFSIADKQVLFSIPAPVSAKKAVSEFEQLCAVHSSSDHSLRERLDVSADLLEMAWEETSSTPDVIMTPSDFIDLVHSHPADHVEAYTAWRFLRTDIAHVFFKELKDHGRVVSFKAKDVKAVEAAKVAFCQSHGVDEGEDELCYVGLLP